MNYIFEIIDKTGRKIHLSKKQWEHITKRHPDMANYLEEIKEALENPLKITDYIFDKDVKYYYKYFKHKKDSLKYLMIVVKYLNGGGFMITSYFEKRIR